MFPSFWGYTCLQMACYLKTADLRMKRSEIWDSGVVVTCILGGTFDLCFIGQLKVDRFSTTLSCLSKMAGHRANWTTIWPSWVSILNVHRVLLTVKNCQGRPEIIRCISNFQQRFFFMKTAGCIAKRTKIWTSGG